MLIDDENYQQVCVAEGTYLDNNSTTKDFERAFKELGFRVKYLEEVITLPDKDKNGYDIPGTGGRTDLFFVVHKDDVKEFGVFRLALGIRWWEDIVIYNNQGHRYPKEILDKYPTRW